MYVGTAHNSTSSTVREQSSTHVACMYSAFYSGLLTVLAQAVSPYGRIAICTFGCCTGFSFGLLLALWGCGVQVLWCCAMEKQWQTVLCGTVLYLVRCNALEAVIEYLCPTAGIASWHCWFVVYGLGLAQNQMHSPIIYC